MSCVAEVRADALLHSIVVQLTFTGALIGLASIQPRNLADETLHIVIADWLRRASKPRRDTDVTEYIPVPTGLRSRRTAQ